MENPTEKKQKWKKLKVKQKSIPTNVHPDYFLVKSVQMDVLIKKQFYDDARFQSCVLHMQQQQPISETEQTMQ